MMSMPLNSPPALYSASDYGIEKTEQVPKLVKSLMHKKVIRISSGGVHNICIVESHPTCILKDIYKLFIEGKFTNVVFKGFYQTQVIQDSSEENNQTMRSHSSSEDLQQDIVDVREPLINRYWHDKSKVTCSIKIKAHAAIISSKSSYFY